MHSLRFTPGDGIIWDEYGMYLMAEYIQHIRNLDNSNSPYSAFLEQFNDLAEEFKDQVELNRKQGYLNFYVEIYPSDSSEKPTWELLPTSIGLSVWNNAAKQRRQKT